MRGYQFAVYVDRLDAQGFGDHGLPFLFHDHVFQQEHDAPFPKFGQNPGELKKQGAARVIKVQVLARP